MLQLQYDDAALLYAYLADLRSTNNPRSLGTRIFEQLDDTVLRLEQEMPELTSKDPERILKEAKADTEYRR